MAEQESSVANNAESTGKIIGGVTGKGFLPGQSGNPSGRPKSKLFSDAYRRILEDEGAEEYAKVVAKDAKEAPKASERLAAAQEMADRTEGRPVQASVIGVGAIDADTAKRLAELAELLVPKSPL